jgi:hypothetical protein
MAKCIICESDLSKKELNQVFVPLVCKECKEMFKVQRLMFRGAREDKEMTFSENDLLVFGNWIYTSSMKGKSFNKDLVQEWMKQRPADKKEDALQEAADKFMKDKGYFGYEQMKKRFEAEPEYKKLKEEQREHLEARKLHKEYDKPQFKVGDWAWHNRDNKAYLIVDKNPIEST